MALGKQRRDARIRAITTAAEMIRSMGEEGSSHEDHQMEEDDFDIYIEECKKVADFLEEKARKLHVPGVD